MTNKRQDKSQSQDKTHHKAKTRQLKTKTSQDKAQSQDKTKTHHKKKDKTN